MARKKFKQNDNNYAIAYYRYSSHAQNEASIDQQREAAIEYAKGHGYKIIREYEDAAISGTTDQRPGFQLMLSEVGKIRPAVLIMWKSDRLGRDVAIVTLAKKQIREAGCSIELVAEMSPEDSPEGTLMERIMDAQAEFYSKQLAVNIQRGMNYNASHALYNGHKILGYDVDENKKYIVDPSTAPFVQRIFNEYANGKPMKEIMDDLDKQGVRSNKGNKITINSLRKILSNRAYLGEYRYSDYVIEGGIPALVDEDTFNQVQERFKLNKRNGSQRAKGLDENNAPRYWLTGKLYCGECNETMQGVSGTSKTGAKHYYYYCKAYRRKKCSHKPIKKDEIEKLVIDILDMFLKDTENLVSLAVDIADYYNKTYSDTKYLESLEAKRKETEKGLANIIKAIESGIFSDTIQERLLQLEETKKALNEAIETENMKQALCEDSHSIQAYFEKYMNTDFENAEMRDAVLEYFVDKIFLYEDKLVIVSRFSENDTEITWNMLGKELNEYDFVNDEERDEVLGREFQEILEEERKLNDEITNSDDDDDDPDPNGNGGGSGTKKEFDCSATSSTDEPISELFLCSDVGFISFYQKNHSYTHKSCQKSPRTFMTAFSFEFVFLLYIM